MCPIDSRVLGDLDFAEEIRLQQAGDRIQAYEDLECRAGYVVYPGKEDYPLTRQVRAIPVEGIESILVG